MLFSTQSNQLDLYDLSALVPAATRTTPVPRAADGGNDVNGQICRIVQHDGRVLYVMGEDTDQDVLPPGSQGWGLFDPTTSPWTLVDKLVPTYNLADGHQPEMTGCVVSADGSRLFLAELGVGAFDVPGTGSLFLYFRDGRGDFSGIARAPGARSRFCVLASDLTTVGYAALDQDGSVLLPESGRSSGGVISRFSPPFPSSGRKCGIPVNKSTFIFDPPRMFAPISIARRNGAWLVAQVVPGLVLEYDAAGGFVRPVVPPGPYNPIGIAVDGAGDLYFANLGLRPDPEALFTPQDGLGSIYRVSFDPLTDAPSPPVPIQAGLDFPDGLSFFPSVLP